MFSWRITKYNPSNRDSNGIYTIKDEWTSYSDIGTIKEGQIFTYEDYKKIEDAYIASILMFMECNDVQRLEVVGLEKRSSSISDSYVSKDMKEIYKKTKNGMDCFQGTIEVIARLVLREKLWCKLEANSMVVHFGYDYYMYIGSVQACNLAVEKIQKMGLYVEKCESPYGD